MKRHEHSGCARKTFEDPGAILVLAGLTKGEKVLVDIGSGSGYLALAAAELMGVGSKVYALDIYREAVDALNAEISEKGITNIEAIKADAVTGIPLPRGTVDICLMSNVAHGFSANGEIDRVMKNINAALKEEGKLILIDFKKLDGPFGPPMDVRLSAEEAEGAVAPYGYTAQKHFDAGRYHYGIVFQRVSLQDKFC